MKRNSSVSTMSTADPIHDYLAGIGRRGGSSTSAAKAAASRVNGFKGGRPPLPSCFDCDLFSTSSCSNCEELTGFRRGVPLYSCPSFTRRAKPSSLKQSCIGRCKPNASGVRPSKRKK